MSLCKRWLTYTKNHWYGVFQIQAGQVLLKQGAWCAQVQVRLELFFHSRRIVERCLGSRGLHKKVERVEHRHFGDQVHRDFEAGGFFRENQAGLVIGKRILLPVDEMLGRLNGQAVRQDAAAAVGGRSQANHLRTQLDRAVVFVMRDVMQSDVNGHKTSGGTTEAAFDRAAWAL